MSAVNIKISWVNSYIDLLGENKEKGLRFNTETYIKCLEELVLI